MTETSVPAGSTSIIATTSIPGDQTLADSVPGATGGASDEIQDAGPSGNNTASAAQKHKLDESDSNDSPNKAPKLSTGADSDPSLDLNAGRPQYPTPSRLWADKRGGLCEASLRFNSYQGSMSRQNGKITGIYLSEGTRPRDILAAEVIITTMSGGRTKDPETGQMVRIKDQGINGFVIPMRKSIETKQPIEVIVSKDYPNFPILLEHNFNILDNFYCTDLWAEQTCHKGQRYTYWVCRLEKIRLEETSWWAPTDTHYGSRLGYATPGVYRPSALECKSCGDHSTKIFHEAWTCLTPTCEEFFKFPPEIDIDMGLTYSNTMLLERTAYTGDSIPDVMPPLPTDDFTIVHPDDGKRSTTVSRVGLACPRCGCYSRRRDWLFWKCENEACGLIHYANRRLISAADTREDEEIFNKRRFKRIDAESHELFRDPCIHREDLHIAGYDVLQYLFPEKDGNIIGSVTLYKATEQIRTQMNGPDDLYQDVQTVNLPLKRRPTRHQGIKSEILTRNFMHNYGAPYKFAVAVDSDSFESAPAVVMKLYHRLNWAGHMAVLATKGSLDKVSRPHKMSSEDFLPFNEMLVIGYMKKDRIMPHDDGEKDLGPTVVTGALGSPSIMRFLPKAKAGIVTQKSSTVLDIAIKHGDIVVMHGSGLQSTYLHGVEPEGEQRFALTCRHIRHDMLSPQDRQLAEVNGKIPEWSYKYVYDGEPSGSTKATNASSESS